MNQKKIMLKPPSRLVVPQERITELFEVEETKELFEQFLKVETVSKMFDVVEITTKDMLKEVVQPELQKQGIDLIKGMLRLSLQIEIVENSIQSYIDGQTMDEAVRTSIKNKMELGFYVDNWWEYGDESLKKRRVMQIALAFSDWEFPTFSE